MSVLGTVIHLPPFSLVLQQPVYQRIANDIQFVTQAYTKAIRVLIFRSHPNGNAQTKILCQANMALTATRGLYLYIEVLKTALEDDILTDDEAAILKLLATALGVSPFDVGDAMDVAKGIDPSPFSDGVSTYSSHQIGDATTYQTALVAALDDEVISEDEWAMLNGLRNLLGIQPDQHALIEEAIRAMSEEDEAGERRIERLARFNTVCPYA
jgi:hypothetical protein